MEKQSNHPSKEAGKSMPRGNRNIESHDQVLAEQAEKDRLLNKNPDIESKKYQEKLAKE